MEIQAQARARRKSVGFSWRQLPMKILFWPDELDKLRYRRSGVRDLLPSGIRQDR